MAVSKKVIGIISGDDRHIYLSNLLKRKDFEVITYEDKESGYIALHADIIVCRIPFVYLEEMKYIKDKTVIGGLISKEDKMALEKNNNKVIDLMEIDSFAIYNAVATAEGTINLMINESDINVTGSKVLVTGFGRCGSIIAEKLKGFGADVTVSSRSNSHLAMIESLGYAKVNTNDIKNIIKDFDFIINTVPKQIIGEDELSHAKKDLLIIDIASEPFGVDFSVARSKGIKVITKRGIPGSVSKRTSGEIIYKVIEEMGDIWEN